MKNELMTIWPVYLDSNRTLKEGRKISKNDAVDDPSLNEIRKACYKLHLKPLVDKDKTYPGLWYEHTGRVAVDADMKKLVLLREVAAKIKEIRN
ncbi:MAG: signal recognition particle subunit SRP19/SEC65 family protein [Methanobrevibacter sp.]